MFGKTQRKLEVLEVIVYDILEKLITLEQNYMDKRIINLKKSEFLTKRFELLEERVEKLELACYGLKEEITKEPKKVGRPKKGVKSCAKKSK